MIRSARRQDVQAITTMLENWIDGMGLEQALNIIIFPFLRLVGELWHQEGISLGGEQNVSRLVRQHHINIIREESPLGRPHALIACFPGDFHEIGPLTASVLLGSIGWHSIYLEPNVSFEMLELALRRKHAQLIILSCIIEPGKLQNWIRNITQRLQPSCEMVVRGPGFTPYAELLSTYKISYFGQVQDVKTVQPRTHLPHMARNISQSSFTT